MDAIYPQDLGEFPNKELSQALRHWLSQLASERTIVAPPALPGRSLKLGEAYADN